MDDVPRRIEAKIPRLRRYAQALYRWQPDADDPVQKCVLRALMKRICGRTVPTFALGSLP